MKSLLFFLLPIILLLPIISVAQPTIELQYNYFFNSEVEIVDNVFNTPNQQYEDITTIVDFSRSSLFGTNIYLPFNYLDKDSPLYSNKFSLDATAFFLYNHDHNRFNQQYYTFKLNYKLSNKEPIYLNTSTNITEIINTPKETAIDGFNYKIGINYNTTNQTTPNLVNFYAELNYFVYSKYNTILPHGNNFINTNDFETIMGIILNIKNILFIEQNTTIYTKLTKPEKLTFTPYYSDYKTKFYIKLKKLTIDYTHICYHTVESNIINPKIGGKINTIGLNYKLF